MGLPAREASIEANALARAWQHRLGRSDEAAVRDELISRYAFAIPDAGALTAIADFSPAGVVELGAGTGFWAHLLDERGVDVVAYDTAPAPSGDNQWFAGRRAWFDVRTGGQNVIDKHSDRTLLVVWPTRNEDWPGDAVQRFAAAGGTRLAYVGEPPGGCTGDDLFFALIGELDRCWACAFGIVTAPCVCGVIPLFTRQRAVALPHWTGFTDDLGLYVRNTNAAPIRPGPPQAAPRTLGVLWRVSSGTWSSVRSSPS